MCTLQLSRSEEAVEAADADCANKHCFFLQLAGGQPLLGALVVPARPHR